MRLRALVPVLALAVVPTLAVPSAVADPAPARNVEHRIPRSGRLQVRFEPGTGETRRAEALARVRARGLSVSVDRRIDALDAFVLDVADQRAVQRLLRNDAGVLYVEPESRYRAFAEPVSPELTEIGAAAVHSAPTPNVGAGQEIAVVDSPVATTGIADLSDPGKVTFVADFTTDDPTSNGDFACDAELCPHGTAVATAAAAEAGDGDTTMVGVAPGAKIRSYGVFRRWVINGWHEAYADSGAIAAALSSIAAYAETNPQLVAVNMSLGGPFDNRLVRDAVALIHDSAPQVTVVVAAGNDGGERANFPAGDPYVLSVGASGQVPITDPCSTPVPEGTPWTVAAFSNRGDVDVVAPGRCVDVWYPTHNATTNAVDPGSVAVRKENGTSFAAPMVAGVVALLGAANVTGDAARAAIISSAVGPAGIAVGAGKANAPAALALGTGTGPYVSMSVDRGGQLASNVGRRVVEVLRIVPGSLTAPAAPTVAASTGFGALTSGTETSAAGYYRKLLTFQLHDVARPFGTLFSITATGTGGDDAITVPMRILDPTDNYEGLPAANNENGTVALQYGTRSAYVRSVAVPATGGTFEWDYTFGEGGWTSGQPHPAELLVWEPPSAGATADAATEPTFASTTPNDTRSYSDLLNVEGTDPHYCEYLGGNPNLASSYRKCRTGRYLLGFVSYSSAANSTGSPKYALRLRYGFGPTVTATAPALASTVSTSGPFGLSWAGVRAVKWDVEYAVMAKGTSWSLGAYTQWKTKTTAKLATFGPVVLGQTYHLKFVAYDAIGNPSLPLLKVTAVPNDDWSKAIVYSTGSTAWTRVSASARWLSRATKTSAKNARATLTADAGGFTVVGDRCSVCGRFSVYVDGVLKKTVDTYKSGTTAVRQVLWSSGTFSGGIRSHRLTIIVAGTSGRPKVVLDGIAVHR